MDITETKLSNFLWILQKQSGAIFYGYYRNKVEQFFMDITETKLSNFLWILQKQSGAIFYGYYRNKVEQFFMDITETKLSNFLWILQKQSGAIFYGYYRNKVEQFFMDITESMRLGILFIFLCCTLLFILLIRNSEIYAKLLLFFNTTIRELVPDNVLVEGINFNSFTGLFISM